MAKWDEDIAAMDLSDVEKNGLQVFRNYNKAFERKRVEQARERAKAIIYDVPRLRGDIEAMIGARCEIALLAACSIADDLLRDMFLRLEKPGLNVKDMVAPLGPLSDLNRRLKVAALADLIDSDDFEFFDRLRKFRNQVAHGRRIHPPNKGQLITLMEATPEWLEAMGSPDIDYRALPPAGIELLFKAGMAMHLGKLALRTVFGPLAKSMNVTVSDLVGENAVATQIGRLSMEFAIGALAMGMPGGLEQLVDLAEAEGRGEQSR